MEQEEEDRAGLPQARRGALPAVPGAPGATQGRKVEEEEDNEQEEQEEDEEDCNLSYYHKLLFFLLSVKSSVQSLFFSSLNYFFFFLSAQVGGDDGPGAGRALHGVQEVQRRRLGRTSTSTPHHHNFSSSFLPEPILFLHASKQHPLQQLTSQGKRRLFTSLPTPGHRLSLGDSE